MQNDPALPPVSCFTQVMSANDEAGKQPLRSNCVLVSEVQALSGLEASRFVGLLFIQQLGNQNALPRIAKRKAKFKLFHESQYEFCGVGGIALWVKHPLRLSPREQSLTGYECMQERVDAFSNPFRLQHIGKSQSGVILVVERNSQIM